MPMTVPGLYQSFKRIGGTRRLNRQDVATVFKIHVNNGIGRTQRNTMTAGDASISVIANCRQTVYFCKTRRTTKTTRPALSTFFLSNSDSIHIASLQVVIE
jgi:hypothetical protein